VPGDARLRPGIEGAQRPAHGAGAAGLAEEASDLAVGRDASPRDGADGRVDVLEEGRAALLGRRARPAVARSRQERATASSGPAAWGWA
jgi:hypothetical protein